MCIRVTLRLPDPGNQTGSQRRQTPSDTGRPPATIVAARRHIRRQLATVRDWQIAPEKRGVAGTNPAASAHLFADERRWLSCCSGRSVTTRYEMCHHSRPSAGAAPGVRDLASRLAATSGSVP